jgi:hypothetical protein
MLDLPGTSNSGYHILQKWASVSEPAHEPDRKIDVSDGTDQPENRLKKCLLTDFVVAGQVWKISRLLSDVFCDIMELGKCLTKCPIFSLAWDKGDASSGVGGHVKKSDLHGSSSFY